MNLLVPLRFPFEYSHDLWSPWLFDNGLELRILLASDGEAGSVLVTFDNNWVAYRRADEMYYLRTMERLPREEPFHYLEDPASDYIRQFSSEAYFVGLSLRHFIFVSGTNWTDVLSVAPPRIQQIGCDPYASLPSPPGVG